MRKWVVAVVMTAALLTGCGQAPSDPDTDPGGNFGVAEVDTPKGTILCVTWKNGYGGGISCDWPSLDTPGQGVVE